MSEDSIACESSVRRAETSVPLPPRKRLLADFKQNGWYDLEQNSHSKKGNQNAGSMPKLEDSASMVGEYRGNELNVRADVKYEDSRDSTSMVTFEEHGEEHPAMARLDDSSSLVKPEEHNDVSEEHGDRDSVNFAADSTDFYRTRQRKSKRLKGPPLVKKTKKKAPKAVTLEKDLHVKGCIVSDTEKKGGEDMVDACEEATKLRRNPSRSRIRNTDQSTQEIQHKRSSLIPPPLSDEELARQLHRAMNSSPRISRSLSNKEGGPLLSPKRNNA